MEARLRVAAGELNRDDPRQGGDRQRPRSAHHQVAGPQEPRQPGEHARKRPAQPHDEVHPESEDTAGGEGTAETHAETAREQERPERGDEQLQRGDERERTPERQDVGRRAERREHRRLPVAHEGAPEHDVRVPQRSVRQPVARVLHEGLELRAGIAELEVRPRVPHGLRLLALPRDRVPEEVRARQRLVGEQRGRHESERQDRIQRRREGRRSPQATEGPSHARQHTSAALVCPSVSSPAAGLASVGSDPGPRREGHAPGPA